MEPHLFWHWEAQGSSYDLNQSGLYSSLSPGAFSKPFDKLHGLSPPTDPPVQEVQLVHGGQPRGDLARHPLQQHGLRVPPNGLLLVAQVCFQVALQRPEQFAVMSRQQTGN